MKAIYEVYNNGFIIQKKEFAYWLLHLTIAIKKLAVLFHIAFMIWIKYLSKLILDHIISFS